MEHTAKEGGTVQEPDAGCGQNAGKISDDRLRESAFVAMSMAHDAAVAADAAGEWLAAMNWRDVSNFIFAVSEELLAARAAAPSAEDKA
jgi:hypothetical protein